MTQDKLLQLCREHLQRMKMIVEELMVSGAHEQ